MQLCARMANDLSTQGMTTPEDEYTRETLKAFEGVKRRAFARYVFELVKGSTEAEDELRRKHFGKEPYKAIRDVRLEGEYPDTVIILDTYEEHRDNAGQHIHPLWKDPTFFDQETGAARLSPEKMASDIAMLARGG
jgi:hypothetical protein